MWDKKNPRHHVTVMSQSLCGIYEVACQRWGKGFYQAFHKINVLYNLIIYYSSFLLILLVSQSALKYLPDLKHLNISECYNVTDKVFDMEAGTTGDKCSSSEVNSYFYLQ